MEIKSFFGLGNTNTNTPTNTNTKPKHTHATQTQNTQNIQESKINKAPIIEQPTGRITYNLSILEQMSDKEYYVFELVTKNMTDIEKINAAQSLYYYTQNYKGLTNYDNLSQNHIKAIRAFGVDRTSIKTFLNQYKRIFEETNPVAPDILKIV